MKLKRNRANRILAIVCSIAMTITLVPVSFADWAAYAAGDQGKAVQEQTPASEEKAQETAEPEESEESAKTEEAPNAEEASQPEENAEEDKQDAEAEAADTTEEQTGSEEDQALKEEKQDKSETEQAEEAVPAEKEEPSDKESAKEDASVQDEGAKEEPEAAEEAPEGFKVTFDLGANYGKFKSLKSVYTDADGSFTIPEKPEVRVKVLRDSETGREYYFTGWKYKDGEFEPGDEITLKDDAVLKAVYKETYTIEYSAKGIEEKPDSQVEVYGEPVVLEDAVSSEEGLDFVGWTPDNGETVFEEGDTVRASNIQPVKRTAGAKVKLLAVAADKTAPVITAKFDSIITETDDTDPENLVTTEKAVFVVTAKDSNPDADITIKYTVSDSESEPDEYDTPLDEEHKAYVVIGSDTQYLHVQATDGDGNTSTVIRKVASKDNLETGLPEVKITGITNTEGNEIDESTATKAAVISFEVTDTFTEEENGEPSGVLNKSDISVMVGDTYYQLDDDDTYTYDESEYKGSGKVTIKGSDDNSLNGLLNVSIEATDACGNTGKSEEKTIIFDNQGPKLVEVTTTKDDATTEILNDDGNYYYNNSVTTTYVVEEANPDNSLTLTYKKNGEEQTVPGTDADGKTTITVTLSDDAINTDFVLSGTDAAGNPIEVDPDLDLNGKPDKFTLSEGKVTFTYGKVIDTKAPKLTNVESTSDANPEDHQGGNYYYNKTVTTIYEVEELNPYDTLELKYEKDGVAQPVTRKEEDGKIIFTVKLSEDAVYTGFNLSGTDAAGNTIEVDPNLDLNGKPDEFTASDGIVSFTYGKVIDTTAPKLTNVDTKSDATAKGPYDEKYYYNKTVTTTYEVAETNPYDTLELKYEKEGVAQPVTRKEEDGKIIFTVKLSEDAVYTGFKLSGTDAAGNPIEVDPDLDLNGKPDEFTVSDGIVSFTYGKVIDTVAPVVTIKYTPTEAVYLYDESGAVGYTNGEVKAELVLSDKDDKDKTDTDLIKINNFTEDAADKDYSDGPFTTGTEEGTYSFLVSGTDRAGNPVKIIEKKGDAGIFDGDAWSVNNHANDKGYVSFVIDKTSPEVKITYDTDADKAYLYDESGIPTAYVNKKVTANIEVSDDNLDYKRIKSNDFDGAEPDKSISETSFNITKEDDGHYSYKIEGCDKAGNPIKVSETINKVNTNYGGKLPAAEQDEAVVEYVIDSKSPTAKVTYSSGATAYLYKENNVTAYVNKNVKAEVEVKDSEKLDSDRIKSNEFGNSDSSMKTDLLKFNSNLKSAEYTATASVEGEYRYIISGTDRAGNAIVITEKISSGTKTNDEFGGSWTAAAKDASGTKAHFVVDKTPPKYTSKLTKVEDEDLNVDNDGKTSYFKKKTNARFDFDDVNLDRRRLVSGTVVATDTDKQYSKAKFEWNDPKNMASKDAAGNYFCEESVKVERDEDQGVYRFTVMGTDKAGNNLEKSTDEKGKSGYLQTVTAPEDKGKGRFWTYKKVLDNTKPGYELNMKDSAGLYYQIIKEVRDKENSKVYKPFRKNKRANITIVGDDLSPIRVEYSIISIEKGSDTNKWSDPVDIRAKGTSTDPVYDDNKVLATVKKGETQFRIKNIRIVDRAGNTRSLSSTNTVYLDGTMPKTKDGDIIKPEVEIRSTSPVTLRIFGKGIYASEVPLKFEVYDPNEHQSSSGLKSVWYEVYVDGKTVKAVYNKKHELKREGGRTFFNYDLDETAKNVEQKGDRGLTYKDSRTITIPTANIYQSNNIKVVLYAEDNSGNVNSYETEFGIDTIKPEVDINISGHSKKGNEYFDDARTMIVKVKDRNFGKGNSSNKSNTKLILHVRKNGKWESVDLLKWQFKPVKGKSVNGNKDTWTATIPLFKDDADYELRLESSDCKDALGNEARIHTFEGEHPTKFTVDTIPPTLKVLFDNNSSRNGKYFNANRTATVIIEERNFKNSPGKSGDPVEYKLTKSNKPRNGGALAIPIGRFSNKRGNVYTAQIPFNQEGNFSFTVDYTDLAGHKAKQVVEPEFVIDKTKPVIKIDNVVEGGIYGGAVAPRAIFDDDNFDKNGMSFLFSGAKDAGQNRTDLTGSFHDNGYGGTYDMNNFLEIKRNDDIYTAYATETDMAGNTTTVQLSFSVNRFGSAFDYNNDSATEGLVKPGVGRYYTNSKENLVLRETNVNPLKSYEATITIGNDSRKLTEGTDFTISKSENEYGSVNIYRFNSDLVTDEGAYEIVVQSEDAAGNINRNVAIRSEEEQNGSVPVKFVYDTTAPDVTFLDMDDNESVIDSLKTTYSLTRRGVDTLNLGIRPSDEWPIASVEYSFEGDNKVFKNEGEIRSLDQVTLEDGTILITIPVKHSTDRNRELSLTITDAAGNVFKTDESNVYKLNVTSNAAEVALQNWYWILAALAAVGGGTGFLVAKKRRKDDEEEAA